MEALINQIDKKLLHDFACIVLHKFDYMMKDLDSKNLQLLNAILQEITNIVTELETEYGLTNTRKEVENEVRLIFMKVSKR